MKLHRANAKPDWETVSPAKRNLWQRVAADTNGVVTPGNVATIVGFLVSLLGLVLVTGEIYLWGLVALGLGRLCDVLDGLLAESTGTKSPLGEMLDAGIDKVITFVALVALLVIGVLPWLVVVVLAAPNIANTGLTLWATRRAIQLHPSHEGKLAMALAWLSIVGFVLAAGYHGNFWFQVLGYLVAALSAVLGTQAALGYSRELQKHPNAQ